MLVRVVLDTNVIVAGVRSRRGASRQWLQYALKDQYTVLATPALFVEYEEVLTRHALLRELGIDSSDISVLLDALAYVVEPVTVSYLWRPQLKDPADEMVLEVAVNGQADYLVTFNIKHFTGVARRFGIHVGTPGNVLEHLLEEVL